MARVRQAAIVAQDPSGFAPNQYGFVQQDQFQNGNLATTQQQYWVFDHQHQQQPGLNDNPPAYDSVVNVEKGKY